MSIINTKQVVPKMLYLMIIVGWQQPVIDWNRSVSYRYRVIHNKWTMMS